MDHLLTVIGLYWFTFKDNNIIFSFCGRVALVDQNKEHIVGYIIEKTYRKWTMLLENNQVIYLNSLYYNEEDWEYSYNNNKKNSTYYIEKYNPICILISVIKYL